MSRIRGLRESTAVELPPSGESFPAEDGTVSTVLDDHVDPNYNPTEQELKEYAEWLGMSLPEDEELMWIAREGLKAPLPKEWKPCKTDTGEVYYFNFKTGDSIWDHPLDEFFKSKFEREKALMIKERQEGKNKADDSKNKREERTVIGSSTPEAAPSTSTKTGASGNKSSSSGSNAKPATAKLATQAEVKQSSTKAISSGKKQAETDSASPSKNNSSAGSGLKELRKTTVETVSSKVVKKQVKTATHRSNEELEDDSNNSSAPPQPAQRGTQLQDLNSIPHNGSNAFSNGNMGVSLNSNDMQQQQQQSSLSKPPLGSAGFNNNNNGGGGNMMSNFNLGSPSISSASQSPMANNNNNNSSNQPRLLSEADRNRQQRIKEEMADLHKERVAQSEADFTNELQRMQRSHSIRRDDLQSKFRLQSRQAVQQVEDDLNRDAQSRRQATEQRLRSEAQRLRDSCDRLEGQLRECESGVYRQIADGEAQIERETEHRVQLGAQASEEEIASFRQRHAALQQTRLEEERQRLHDLYAKATGQLQRELAATETQRRTQAQDRRRSEEARLHKEADESFRVEEERMRQSAKSGDASRMLADLQARQRSEVQRIAAEGEREVASLRAKGEERLAEQKRIDDAKLQGIREQANRAQADGCGDPALAAEIDDETNRSLARLRQQSDDEWQSALRLLESKRQQALAAAQAEGERAGRAEAGASGEQGESNGAAAAEEVAALAAKNAAHRRTLESELRAKANDAITAARRKEDEELRALKESLERALDSPIAEERRALDAKRAANVEAFVREQTAAHQAIEAKNAASASAEQLALKAKIDRALQEVRQREEQRFQSEAKAARASGHDADAALISAVVDELAAKEQAERRKIEAEVASPVKAKAPAPKPFATTSAAVFNHPPESVRVAEAIGALTAEFDAKEAELRRAAELEAEAIRARNRTTAAANEAAVAEHARRQQAANQSYQAKLDQQRALAAQLKEQQRMIREHQQRYQQAVLAISQQQQAQSQQQEHSASQQQQSQQQSQPLEGSLSRRSNVIPLVPATDPSHLSGSTLQDEQRAVLSAASERKYVMEPEPKQRSSGGHHHEQAAGSHRQQQQLQEPAPQRHPSNNTAQVAKALQMLDGKLTALFDNVASMRSSSSRGGGGGDAMMGSSSSRRHHRDPFAGGGREDDDDDDHGDYSPPRGEERRRRQRQQQRSASSGNRDNGRTTTATGGAASKRASSAQRRGGTTTTRQTPEPATSRRPSEGRAAKEMMEKWTRRLHSYEEGQQSPTGGHGGRQRRRSE